MKKGSVEQNTKRNCGNEMESNNLPPRSNAFKSAVAICVFFSWVSSHKLTVTIRLVKKG